MEWGIQISVLYVNCRIFLLAGQASGDAEQIYRYASPELRVWESLGLHNILSKHLIIDG